MSDVVLIYPLTGLDVSKISIGLPLPLLTIASELVGEFSVKIIDQRVEKNWRQILQAELKTGPLCVGITAMTGHQIHFGLEVCRIVREHSVSIPTVWGGMHVTLLPDESIQNALVDIIVRGDGEWVFRDLVRTLAAKKSIEEVRGIHWRDKKGKIHANPDAPTFDLNQSKPYPFELLDVEHYVSPGEYLFPGVKRVLPFIASRGCPYKCTFCSQPKLTKVYRTMSPELVYERTMDMVRRFNLDMILFYDDEFLVNQKWALRIAELINGQFKWWIQARANDFLKVDIRKLESGGLHATAPGLESGSDRILQFINKQETVSEYREVNRRLAQTGIHAVYNLMTGFPGETLSEIHETLDLAMELIRDNPKAYLLSLSVFTPLPGTVLTEQSKQWGYVSPDSLEGWIETSRHNWNTPWVNEHLDRYRSLSYTSKFVGKRAKMAFQRYRWIPPFIFDLYSGMIQRRWKKRILRSTWDVKFIHFVHEKVVNPMLNLNKKKGENCEGPQKNKTEIPLGSGCRG